MRCTECRKEISKEEYNENNGYCDECRPNKHNITAKIIKAMAILGGILGAIAGLVLLSDDEKIGMLYLIISVISAIFINGFGEIIQLLEDIKNK